MGELTHIDKNGSANMVDVGNKPPQEREAIAEGYIDLQPSTIELVRDNLMKKGDVLTIAQIAGIQSAKKCSDLIPLCHPLMLSKIDVDAQLCSSGVYVRSRVKCIGKTGVEMEALTAVSTALLTVYDMCKAVDKEMVLRNITLVSKTKKDLPNE